jgi:hypothetical protein
MMDSGGVLWTIALVRMDDDMGLWRPMTGSRLSGRTRGAHGTAKADT